MAECIYKTNDGYCSKHSDDVVKEWCVEGPCTDERLPEPPKEDDHEIPRPHDGGSAQGAVTWVPKARIKKSKEAGKSMPCNPGMVPFWERPGAPGKVVLQGSGKVISCDLDGPRDELTGFGYISHFSTCPQARGFRRKK